MIRSFKAVVAALLLLVLWSAGAHATANGSIGCTGVSANFQSVTCPDINEELTNANNRGIIRLGSVSGTNTILANATPFALTSYADGQHFTLKPANDITGSATLNINSLGAKAIVKQSGAVLASGDLDSDAIYTLQYYAADDHFRVMGAVGTPGVDDDVPEIGDLTAIDTSAELRTLLTDETGTGAAMFGLTTSMADDLGCTGNQVVRRNAGDTAFECATGGGGLASTDIDTSAELRAIMTDELGTGVLFFLGAPAGDDQAFVSTSTSAGAWGTIPDSDGATQKLQYDQATNAFSAGTDDDVPEVGDFAALVGGSGIDNNSGTLDLDLTELNTFTLGAGAATGIVFDAGATDPAIEVASGIFRVDIGGTDELSLSATNLNPGANDGNALGASGTAWADLFLAAGGLIEFDGGTTNTFTCTGGNCTIEGNGLYRAGGTDVAVADGGTGASSLNDLIALTTHTTGNYVATITAGTGISGSSSSEGGTPTIAFDFSDAGASPSLGADECRFTSNATTGGYIVCEGDTADAFETRIAATDPTADRVMTIPNADSNPVQPGACGGSDKVTGISSAGVISCGPDAGAGGGISNVVEDTTPQLGGALDTNGFGIEFGTANTDTTVVRSSAGNISIEGNIVYRAGGTNIAIADGGCNADDAATCFANIKQAASDTATGVVELATTAEAAAQTDTARAVTPAGLAFKPESFCLAASDETSNLTTGTNKVRFRIPYAFTVTDVRGSLSTVATGASLLTIDVNEAGTTILSTKLTFDASESTTTTAATARVISDTALANDAEIGVDIDQIGNTTPGQGLKVCIIGHQ